MARATAQAAELDPAELRAGGERLAGLIADRHPGVLAVAGVTAYRTAFGRPRAAVGPQPDTLGGARLWILPNPSGLNASWTLPGSRKPSASYAVFPNPPARYMRCVPVGPPLRRAGRRCTSRSQPGAPGLNAW